MTEVLIKPTGAALTGEPRIVDLSTSSIDETLRSVEVTAEDIASFNERKLRQVKFLANILPADSFEPFKLEVPQDPNGEDRFFAFLRELNKLNEMIGGNGIDIETVK